MEEDLQHAIAVLGQYTGLFDPFRIIRMKGIDGAPVFDSIVPHVVYLGAGILLILSLMEFLRHVVRSTGSEKQPIPVLGISIKIAVAAGGLLAYKPFVMNACGIFPSLGIRILSVVGNDLSVQAGSALSTIQIESISQFKVWTGTIFDMTASALVAAILSFLAFILLWVMSLLQGFLWAFWFLVGPLALPCMVFKPMAHVMRNWMMSLLGVSFWSVTGSLMAAIAVKAQFLDKAFAAGSMGDFLVSLVYSAISVALIVSTVGLANQAFSSIDLGIQGAYQAAKSAGRSVSKSGSQGKPAESAGSNSTGSSESPSTPAAPGSGGI